MYKNCTTLDFNYGTHIKVYNYNIFKNPYYRIDHNFVFMQDNRKKMLRETNNCTKINSIGQISCKKIYGYNFYFLNKNN